MCGTNKKMMTLKKKQTNLIAISAIICTHNRSELVIKALRSLQKQSINILKYEVIIVDNASTDNTAEIITENFSNIKNFKYVCEPKIGLSNARNTGIKNSNGKYVAFLDDDAVASPVWLESIINCFQQDSNIKCVGGRINLDWNQNNVPGWLSSGLFNYLGSLDLKQSKYLNSPTLGGGNIAFLKSIFSQIGYFSANLGRCGNKLFFGEETAMQLKLFDLGYKVFYSQEALIYHFANPKRLNRISFLKQAFFQGISSSLLHFKICPSKKRMFNFIVNSLLLSFFKNILIISFLFLLPNRSFKRFVFLNYGLGCWYGVLKLRKFKT